MGYGYYELTVWNSYGRDTASVLLTPAGRGELIINTNNVIILAQSKKLFIIKLPIGIESLLELNLSNLNWA